MASEHSLTLSISDVTDAISHTFRHDRRSASVQWRLQGASLAIEREGQPAERVDLSRAVQLRICKAPSPWDMKRFRCDLVLDDGSRHTLCSTSWLRGGRYEDRAASYAALVSALAVAVADQAPGCRIVGASQPWTYWTIGGLIALAVVLGAALLVSNPPQALTADHFWGIAVPLCMLAFLASVLGCTLPRQLNAAELDERFLPRAA